MAPTENEKNLEFMFDDALKLRDAGDLAGARRMLESLIAQLEPTARRFLSHAHTQLGRLCEQLEDQRAREIHYRAAVAATPRYDLPSLGLFHTLYESRRRTEALEEAVRFLRSSYSTDYAEMVMGMFDDTDLGVLRANFTPDQKLLLGEARRLILRGRKN